MCKLRCGKMTGNLEQRTGSSVKWLPDSSVKYKSMSDLTDWWPGSLKYQVPKSVRRKILIFLFVVAVACVLLVYFCYNCYLICSGSCGVLNIKQDLMTTSAERAHGISHQSMNSQSLQAVPRLPSCIIIGVRKSGTRALLQYMSLHPDTVINAKEQHFFNTDRYKLGLDYYRSQMPKSLNNQIIIEKTPAYFTDLMTPERIYRMNNSIKLILIVREPVIRLISDYTQLRKGKEQRNKTAKSFEELVLDNSGKINTDYKPVQRSMYYHYFINWLEFFSRDQIYICDGDAFITNPYSELYDIETFLHLPHKIPSNVFYFNASKGFYCINDETLDTPCLSEAKGRQHPKIDPAVLEALYDFYRPRNKLFFKLAQRTFDWP